MAYDKPQLITYSYGSHDFAAAGQTLSLRGPAGKVGKIVHIEVAATEVFNAVTTAAFVRVGTAADNDAYAELNLATTADTDVADESTDTDAIIAGIPADTQVEVNFVANTGGTPTGIGYVQIAIEWF